MKQTADLICDPHASSCELFQVTWQPPCQLGFECHGESGDLRLGFAPGYCIDLIVEGLLAGVSHLVQEEPGHQVDFVVPGTDRTAFFFCEFERDIDGIVLRLNRIKGHKKGLEVWMRITGPYGLDLALRTTILNAQRFAAQLELIYPQIPGRLQSSPEEWAVEEAIEVLGSKAQKRQKDAALKLLISLSTSDDQLLAVSACEALGKAKGSAVEAALKRAISHPAACVRGSAGEALGHAAGGKARNLLRMLLADDDPAARLGAVRGIGLSLGAGAEATLLRVLKKEKDGRVIATIAGVLLAHGQKEARLILAELLTSSDSSVRSFAKAELQNAGVTPGWREPPQS